MLGAILAIAILLQMLYPFLHGQVLQFVTISGIYAGALAMLLHAYYSFGMRYAATYLIITLIFALAIEQIGVSSGWPFGDHSFDSSLGAYVYKVPLVIPFISLMLAHPILVAARRVTQQWAFIYGGAIMMAWHLFIDPQLAIAHRVIWTSGGSRVPFENELPVSTPAGWLFAGMLLIAILHFALPKERRKQGAEFVAVDIFLGWTLLAGIFDNIFFFNRPEIALFAGAIYAVVLAPYFFSRWLGKPGD
jgi:putative membrane protein